MDGAQRAGVKRIYWSVTVIGTLWLMEPETALIVTCTVLGVPPPGAGADELHPLTPIAMQLATAINKPSRANNERLRKPANASKPIGPRKASVVPERNRNSLPVS